MRTGRGRDGNEWSFAQTDAGFMLCNLKRHVPNGVPLSGLLGGGKDAAECSFHAHFEIGVAHSLSRWIVWSEGREATDARLIYPVD